MDLVIIRERLTAARDQYHRLMTGKAIRVMVDQNGERVEYTAVSAANLMAYIKQLEGMLDAASGTNQVSGPLRFMW